MEKNQQLRIRLNEPKLMEFNLDLGAIANNSDWPDGINFLVGSNGTGKTFVLVTQWLTQSILNARLISKRDVPLEFVQQLVDGCYDSELDGEIGVHYKDTVSIEIEFEKGKVVSCNIDVLNPELRPRAAIYMSKNTRTFDQMTPYYALRKTMSADEIVGKKIFKAYDSVFLETLRLMVRGGASESQLKRLNEGLSMFLEEGERSLDISEVGFDEEECKYFMVNKGERVFMNTKSAGEQSIINIVLTNTLQH